MVYVAHHTVEDRIIFILFVFFPTLINEWTDYMKNGVNKTTMEIQVKIKKCNIKIFEKCLWIWEKSVTKWYSDICNASCSRYYYLTKA